MAETEIEWTARCGPDGKRHKGFTFNPVHGCFEIGPACDNCYAREFDKLRGGPVKHWGVNAPLREFGDAHWNEPLKWNRRAFKLGVRLAVFCASMADVFDNRWPEGVRDRLWKLIKATPNLDWLLLTKRIGNAADMFPDDWSNAYPNVSIGITVIDQAEADRDVPKLLATSARIRFLSIEPMLGPIDLSDLFFGRSNLAGGEGLRRIHQVICGGESGAKARPIKAEWARSLRDQCFAADVAFYFKQWGEWISGDQIHPGGAPGPFRLGKKEAGNLLDGRKHTDYPASAGGALIEP